MSRLYFIFSLSTKYLVKGQLLLLHRINLGRIGIPKAWPDGTSLANQSRRRFHEGLSLHFVFIFAFFFSSLKSFWATTFHEHAPRGLIQTFMQGLSNSFMDCVMELTYSTWFVIILCHRCFWRPIWTDGSSCSLIFHQAAGPDDMDISELFEKVFEPTICSSLTHFVHFANVSFRKWRGKKCRKINLVQNKNIRIE